MKQQYLWLAVTADKYELPLAVCDTAEQLGRIFGLKGISIINHVHRGDSGKQSGRRFVKVRLNDE